MSLEDAVPVEGGIPLVSDGKIIGAIGLSGANSDQDGQCATAGAALLNNVLNCLSESGPSLHYGGGPFFFCFN